MTSTASQQNPIPAQSSSASAATSYASAAGAKKPTSTPLTGAHPPVVVGSSAAIPQNGKPSASPVNGRPNVIPPAVPVAASIARSSSAINGGPADHSRKSSVTIPPNAPHSHIGNGGPVGGHKNIQFGYPSPAVANSTLHQGPEGGARPVPIPGVEVPSPAQSPLPIPQMPQQSGGQRVPPNTQPPVTFGSFPNDSDSFQRHMKQQSVSHNLPMGGPPPHHRRESHGSTHGESAGHVGTGHRGGYSGGGRGRGGYNPQYANNANQFQQRPYNGPNAGRGGMHYQGRGGMQQFPNSPQPSRASPAPVHANLHHTPTMPAATPLAPGQAPFYPQMYPPHQVKLPPSSNDFKSFGNGKKNKSTRRGDTEKQNQSRQANSWQNKTSNNKNDFGQRPRSQSNRWSSGGQEFHQDINGGPQQIPVFNDGPPARYGYASWRAVPVLPPPYLGQVEQVDLSPEHGDFENKLLTAKQKQMQAQYGQPLNPYSHPMPPYSQYPQPNPYMGQPPQPTPGFQQAYIPPPFNPTQPGASAMSRNPSQVSDRPGSSTGPNQAPAIAQGTPQPRPAQVAAPVVVSSNSNFKRPTKNKGIVIKDPNGNPVDFRGIAPAPASPAPSIQQSKTPPIQVSSTPTPPPKSATPSHVRAESTAGGKTAEQLRNEFKSAVFRATEGPSKEEEAAKAAAEEKAKEEERLKAEEKAAAEKKAADEAKAKEEAELKAKAEAEDKAKLETEEKAKAEKEKAEAEAKAKEQAKAEEEKTKAEEKATAEPEETEDERMERMIREMEEEDARREKEQEAITARKKAEAEEAKRLAEINKKKSAADADEELRRQEREMERLEEEREQKRKEQETTGKTESVADLLTKKIGDLKLSDKKEPDTAQLSSGAASKPSATDKPGRKPQPLNLAPLNTKPVEAPQPSAALQSLRTSRFLPGVEFDIYPAGIQSPNPALNAAVHKKGKVFKYDAQFLLQFQGVFTEQPSTEFHQQVKSLIGDSDRSASARTPGAGSGRQNSRANTSGGFPAQPAMGQFGASSKPLPPGTTSEQRFAMSQGSGSARPAMGGGMSFGRGAFPGQLGRTPSSTGPGGVPNSPRQGSRRGGGSKRTDFNSKNEHQAAKVMPLTAGMDLKPITVSASGWKPTSIGKGPAAAAPQPGHLDPEMVQRKVKAALNKMTPEKFDKISDQILEIAGQSKNEQDGRTLRQVIQLTFEKATDEAHWASMYAKFCKRMLEMMSPEIRDEGILDKQGNVVSGGALFRKYLLNRCQEEFERGWKVDLPKQEGEDGKAGEAALLSDEYYIAAAAKRRGLGLVQFIGELYKLGMLTERIMHECVRKLLEFQGIPDEAEIESLTKLLRTIGGNLDSTEKGRPMMEAYFQRIDNIMAIPELPSRLKYMLMDVVDLRKKRWASKDTNKGPKTLEEIRAEAEAAAAQKAAESARSNQRGPGGRPGGGRGDNRGNFMYTQPAPNTVGMDDLRRLKGNVTRSSSQTAQFGPTSMFSSRSNSGRRMGGPGGAFSRGGEDSGTSSRTGTPPVAHTNAFGLLADTGDHPASPPSTSASPAMSKVTPDTTDKKE
ncbi:hypothetical protein QBC37DRAFT_370079 [Rhypophila decipiens]|uniref:MIF4G domain-containing protein n=1 Tax=Rhypophila decipiens TaxID=261697 RepID=A0AAN7B993_9PEZI|nr:hypothetical protein QBC37DRAFT_370079 [Rhypophila decipiens]